VASRFRVLVEVEAEQPVERERRRHVGNNDPKRIEASRHRSIVSHLRDMMAA
jgi:hypothetical protein